jgi:hypothetical protein
MVYLGNDGVGLTVVEICREVSAHVADLLLVLVFVEDRLRGNVFSEELRGLARLRVQ